ncbi:Assimilatory nitrate reductase large subunit (plasmid) [Rhodococcus sp. WAY2]|nr:Assimilatory nitrate reductase large subunit [Rhodococcus sp. WAY2]
MDTHLAEGVTAVEVDRGVQSASILHSNGDALDIAVKVDAIVGVSTPPNHTPGS